MASLPDIKVKLNVDVDIKVNVSDVPDDVRGLTRAKCAEVIASLTTEPDPASVLPPFGDK